MSEADRTSQQPPEPATPDGTAEHQPDAPATTPPPAGHDPRAAAAQQAPRRAADLIADQRGDRPQAAKPQGTGQETALGKSPAAANPIDGQRPEEPAGGRKAGQGGVKPEPASKSGNDLSEAGEATGEAAGEATKNAAGAAGAAGAASKDAAGGAAGKASGAADGAAGKLGGATGGAGKPGEGPNLSMPEGDNLKEKGAHLAGQAADEAARQYVNKMAGGAPVYDAVKNSKLGDKAMNRAEKSPAGRLLPQKFKEGFRGDSKKEGKKGKKEEKDEAAGEGSGSGGRGKYTKVLILSLPFAAPIVILMLLLGMVMGAGSAFGDPQTQPEGSSDAKIAKYLPGEWLKVLKQAADRAASSGAPEYAIVPWTVLAGIVKTQTDFARYSPYDDVDRDPGRHLPEIPGGGGGGGGPVPIGPTEGAGPGPIVGVSGPGDSGSLDPGHPGPPNGDLSHQLGWYVYSLRMHESNGNYKARNASSGACGAYQYITSTWNNFEGYPTACDAPPSVQDKRAVRDLLGHWNRYNRWQQVSAHHLYPIWAGSTQNWNRCPLDNCRTNPTVWGYVDDVMKRMTAIAQQFPATTQPSAYRSGPGDLGGDVRIGPFSPGGSAVAPVAAGGVRTGQADTARTGKADTGGALSLGLNAGGCAVANPSPPIGGKGSQGRGPYLLTPASADDMKKKGLDPQNPCESSYYVARKLSEAAKQVHADPKSPPWKSNGTDEDKANARKYWSKAITFSGMFVQRGANPDAPCAVPPPDDPQKPWSISFKIISIWRCETIRMPELYLVTDAREEVDKDKKKWTYTVETDRAAATKTLVTEALSVSYGASQWKTDKCDNGKDERQGIFPMTKQEASEAKVDDRCDVDKNIVGAARLVLSVEAVKPEERPADRGPFQPMIGGWLKLRLAMGDEAEVNVFSRVGPGRGFTASDACTTVMTSFLTTIAPQAAEFAELKGPPDEAKLPEWRSRLQALAARLGATEPSKDPACQVGSFSPGFNAAIVQVATGLADDGPHARNLDGLSNYFQGEERDLKPKEPVAGSDTLVIPRLAFRPLKEIAAPIDPDATEAWTRLGTTEGVAIPLEQLAIEYAWFFGGVIAPFDSAGKLIGSLAAAGGGGDGTKPPMPGQTTVGPDGCPEQVPANTLRHGSDKIGVHKLCVDSVAQARTPQAAMAIKWALSHLGYPYCMCGLRNTTNFDCSSFVSRSYRDSGAIPNLYQGNAPTTHKLRNVPWAHQITFAQVAPGDLVEPHSGHVAMQLADGYKVHTNDPSDVSRIERAYSSAYWSGWVDANAVK